MVNGVKCHPSRERSGRATPPDVIGRKELIAIRAELFMGTADTAEIRTDQCRVLR